jgi:L-fucose/D-arabinose isomerase
MNNPRVALVTFGDHRPNEWEKVFKDKTIDKHKKLLSELKQLPIDLLWSDEVARTREQINTQIDDLKSKGAEVFVAHTPCWTSPNLVVHGVQRMDLPTLVFGNRDPGTHGCVGLLGASGALGQIGYEHKTLRMDYNAEEIARKALSFLRAASAGQRLKGSVFGYFGGRSIGIDTSQFDPMQWRKQFGVDAEHIDQVEIIRLAGEMDQARIDKMRTWIEEQAKEVLYNKEKLTKEKFDFQIACYLATKDLVKMHGLDFTAVKCMPELSNSYVPQCMTAAFLPNDYDGEEGDKDPVVMACEADADGALTQQILKILSGGAPTFFADVSHIDNERNTIYCVNCGAMCAWYAARSDNPAENMKKISIRQSVRPGGAGITYFNAAPGPMQLARLYRKDGRYRMAIIPCKAITPDQKLLDEFVEARGPHQLPSLFAEVDFDLDNFVSEYGSNHISGVAGYYEKELVELCTLLDIEPVVFK